MCLNKIVKYLMLWCCSFSFCLYAQDRKLSRIVEQEIKGVASQKQDSSKKESEVLSSTPIQQKQESQAVIDVAESQKKEPQTANNRANSQSISILNEQGKKETFIVIEESKEEKNILSDCEEKPSGMLPKTEESSEDRINRTTGFVYNYNRVKTKEITPYAGSCARRAVDVYFEGDYIYWNAREEGLEYAASGVMELNDTSYYPVVAAGTYKLPQGNVYGPDFKTRSGFKAGVGLNFSYDGWSLGGVYTRLTSTANGEAANAAGLLPVQQLGFIVQDTNVSFGGFSESVAAQQNTLAASSNWHLNFNVLDIGLAREYFISSKIILKPNLGIKFTMQKQHYNVFFDHSGVLSKFPVSDLTVLEVGKKTPTTVPFGKTEVLNIALAGEASSCYNVQNYWGFGPRVGSNLSWLFSKNFSLFGEGALSTLWGRFKDDRQDIANVVDLNTGAVLVNDFTGVNVRNTKHDLNAALELQIGLRCDIWSSKGDVRFRMQVGWENQVWFAQNHFSNFNSRVDSNNLVLQGLTVQVSFDF